MFFQAIFRRRPPKQTEIIGTATDRKPRISLFKGLPAEATEEDLQHHSEVRKESDETTFAFTRVNIDHAQSRQKRQYDEKTKGRKYEELQEGDTVLLHNTRKAGTKGKGNLKPNYDGPYRILNIKKKVVTLQNMKGQILKKTYNIDRLKLYKTVQTPEERQEIPKERQKSSDEQQETPTAEKQKAPGEKQSSAGKQKAPGEKQSPAGKQKAPGEKQSPAGKQKAPGEKQSPAGKQKAPGEKQSPAGQQKTPREKQSPAGKQKAPGEKQSPAGKQKAPGEKQSPAGKQKAPGEKQSPAGKQKAPGEKQSPAGKQKAPGEKQSPAGKQKAPGEKQSPAGQQKTPREKQSTAGKQKSSREKQSSAGKQKATGEKESPAGKQKAPEEKQSPAGKQKAHGGKQSPAGKQKASGVKQSPAGKQKAPREKQSPAGKQKAPEEKQMPRDRQETREERFIQDSVFRDVLERIKKLDIKTLKDLTEDSNLARTDPVLSFMAEVSKAHPMELERMREAVIPKLLQVDDSLAEEPSLGFLMATIHTKAMMTGVEVIDLVDTLLPRPTHLTIPKKPIDTTLEAHQRLTVGGETLDQTDMATLEGRHWLNDKVINAYLTMLKTQSNNESTHVFVLPSYTAVLWENGRFDHYLFKKVKLSLYSKVLLPVNIGGNHWALMVADVKVRTVSVLDSMEGSSAHHQFFNYWRKFMSIRETQIREGLDEWDYVPTSCGKQTDGNSCGVFVLMNAECIIKGVNPAVMRQVHTHFYRTYARSCLFAEGSKKTDGTCDFLDCQGRRGHQRWVQCAVCGRWMHTRCCGISTRAAIKDEYECVYCTAMYD